MFLATRSRKVAALLARRWREVRAWARALRHRMGTRAGIPLAGARRWVRAGLPGPLVLSVVIHAVGLGALGRVTFRTPTASTPRYTRIRLMKWEPAQQPEGVPDVSLPGGRARAVALPPTVASDPTLEARRQAEARIAALRADFFAPMRISILPMPVLPWFDDDEKLLPPPLWNVPLGGNLRPLPSESSLGVDPEAHDAPEPPARAEKPADSPAVVDTPDEPAATEQPVEVAEAPAGPVVSVPDEQPRDPVMEATRGTSTAASPEGVLVAQAEPGDAPRAEETPAAETPELPKPDAATPESATPVTADPGGGMEMSGAPAREAAPAGEASTTLPEAPAPVVETPSEAKASSSEERPKDGSGAAAVARTEKPQIPADGTHAGLTGSFRVLQGLALPGLPPSGSMPALLAEIGKRTALKVTSAGTVAPDAIPADALLVYLRAASKVTLDPQERAALSAYLRGGGILFIDGADGEAGDALRAQMEALAGGKAERLPATHALYSAHYRIPGAPGAKLFPLMAIPVEGRPAILLSPAFLGRRWQDATDPEHESAVALGVNLVVHTAAERSRSGAR